MSADNVEVIRRIFEAFPAIKDRMRRGEYPIGEPFADDVEWDASAVGLPDAGDGIFRGHEGLRRFWSMWLSAWDDVIFDYELRDRDPRVVALITQRMRTSAGLDLPTRDYALVYTFGDGQIIHGKLIWDQEEALGA